MIIGKKYYWVFQLLGWSFFFLWQLFSAWSVDKMNTAEDQLFFIKRATGFSVIGLFATHLLRISLLKLHVFSKRVFSQIIQIICFTIVIAVVAGCIEMILYQKLEWLSKGEQLMYKRSFWLILSNNSLAWLSIFITWSAIYFIYHYVAAAQKEQIDNLRLKSLIKELELKTIKTRINPHFIFNSLNGIRAMVDENPQRARTAITELSNILRSSINIDKFETVSLRDELNIIKDYLALEQMRFEDRLVVHYEIDEKSQNQSIPPMMLQMMVENAIKHGISHEIKGGTVKIMSSLSNNMLSLVVENTGKLKEPIENDGFGIKSIKERLRIMFGNNADFKIYPSGSNKVVSILRLPNTL